VLLTCATRESSHNNECAPFPYKFGHPCLQTSNLWTNIWIFDLLSASNSTSFFRMSETWRKRKTIGRYRHRWNYNIKETLNYIVCGLVSTGSWEGPLFGFEPWGYWVGGGVFPCHLSAVIPESSWHVDFLQPSWLEWGTCRCFSCCCVWLLLTHCV